MTDLINLDNVLAAWAEGVIAAIQSNLERQGINATGKTSESLEYQLTNTGIQILAAPYFAERTEIGRTPTVNHKSWDFASAIKDWITAKGIESHFDIGDDRDLNKVSKAIAMKISKYGSAKYRGDWPKTDVYSSVLDESVNQLSDELAVSGGEILMGVLDDYEREIGRKVGTKSI